MSDRRQVRFTTQERNGFHQTVRSRVDAFFKEHGLSPHADRAMVLKTVVLVALYIGPFVALLIARPELPISLALWFLMGLGLAGIGMSVMHDANHGAYSADERINWWLGHTLNLCGGSARNWKLQHNILHHTYTNITHVDEDIEDRLVLKFSPHTGKRWYHRFQWAYAIVFYGLLTLYWVLAKDLVQFALFARDGVGPARPKERRRDLGRIIALKAVYFVVILGAPLAAGVPWMQVLVGFLLMHFVSGIVLTVVFQLAHSVEGTSHPLPDADGRIMNDWAVHQMETTVDFAPDNRLLSWYIGGLNYQIEHHLFPRVAHVHYPAIAPIVRRTAEEFGVPYRVNATFTQALRSHFALLRALGLPRAGEAIN